MRATIIKIKNSKYTFYTLLTGIIFFFAFYMYCINSAVRFAVARNNYENKISYIQENLSELETKYIQNVSALTLESAKSKGFVDPSVKEFLSKNSKGEPLSINR